MKYLGSKNRFAGDLLRIILRKRKPDQFYVEPFVGGANMMDKVTGNRIGNDVDADLISMWQAVASGWTPPINVTEHEYESLKSSPLCPLKGYAAFALSFSGKKWGGWCRDSANVRNYVQESYQNALEQFPRLVGVDFRLGSYRSLYIPQDSIVYCDPPYGNGTGYEYGFDSPRFWEWCRGTSESHSLFVSEYAAPDDFLCIYEKRASINVNAKAYMGKDSVERLFIHKDSRHKLLS